MSDLCVQRAIEPAQDEVLAHLFGIGAGRAITVLGDVIGTRLAARPPVVRFVSVADEPDPGRDDDGPPRHAVRSDLHGSVAAHVVTWMPRTTVSYFVSRVGVHDSWRDDAATYHDVAARDLGSIVLSSVIEGMRPILPDRGWFSDPALAHDASHWWQDIGQNAVGGLHARLEVEDSTSSMEFDVCLLTGPRGLDLLLGAVENLLEVA